MNYLTGFAVEKALAMENVFAIAMIFGFLSVPRRYQRRVFGEGADHGARAPAGGRSTVSRMPCGLIRVTPICTTKTHGRSPIPGYRHSAIDSPIICGPYAINHRTSDR